MYFQNNVVLKGEWNLQICWSCRCDSYDVGNNVEINRKNCSK